MIVKVNSLIFRNLIPLQQVNPAYHHGFELYTGYSYLNDYSNGDGYGTGYGSSCYTGQGHGCGDYGYYSSVYKRGFGLEKTSTMTFGLSDFKALLVRRFKE